MDFTFNEEQSLIQGQVEQFIQRDYDWETRQSFISSDLGFSSDNWKTFAELGWLGISLSEESGGFGGTSIDTMIVMEEFGKGLVLEPFLETVVMCAGLIDMAGSPEQKKDILTGVVEGKTQLALAYAEPQSRFNLFDVMTEAKKEGDNYILNGFKSVVMNGPNSHQIIVSARTSGDQRDESGVSLFIVDANSSGLSLRDYQTVDNRRASEVTLESVTVPLSSLIGELDQGLSILESSIDRSILAISAEAVGAMEVLYKTTVEYTKTREQFGTAIGKFQVLQHRMVDMFMQYEQSVSMTYMVNLKLSEDELERRKAASGAKVQICNASKFIGQSAVQLHGGMGMTDELNVGHYFKRLAMIETQFGNADHHLKKYSSAS